MLTFRSLFQLKKPSDRRRIHLLDEIRGGAVLCMVFYHGFYTFSAFYHWDWCTMLYEFFRPIEPAFAALFIFISGIAANLTRSNLSRGIKLAVIAAAITIITLIVTPQQPIYFGVLHLLAAGMILSGLILPLLNKLPVWPSVAICAVIVMLTYDVWNGYIGFFTAPLIQLPEFLYSTDWLCWLGMYTGDFFSADYFPILPWLFVFLGGVFFGRFAKTERFPEWTYRNHVRFFSFIGRHALIIYLVHQPLFYGIGLLGN